MTRYIIITNIGYTKGGTTMAVAPVVETAESVAAPVVEAVAPAVSAGTLDYKLVAITAAGTLAVTACAYFGYKAIKKRKAAKKEEPVMDCVSEEPTEATE